MRKVMILVLLFTVVASSAVANGQRKRIPPVLGVSGSQPIPSALQKWPKVTLNVLALDRVKEPFTLPDPSVIEVSEEQKAQTIKSVAGPGTPVSLCLLIDHSSSLRSFRGAIDDAATSLIKHLPQESEAMVAVFEGESVLAVPFTAAATFDRGMLTYPALRGGSAIFDSLVATDRYFLRYARYERRALVLITDGSENGSEYSLSETARLMQIPDGPLVFALQIPHKEIRDERRHDNKMLDKLTKATGGFVFEADERSDILTSSNKISQAISHQYAVTYTSSQTAPDNRLRRLEVWISQVGIELCAAPGYYPSNM
jgi:Ca-activated chloride channel family protein